MSLSEIFDPVVRAYYKKRFGGSGDGNNSVTVIDVNMDYAAAMQQFPVYDLSDSMGVILIRVSDNTPSSSELMGGKLFWNSDVNNFHRDDLSERNLKEDYGVEGMVVMVPNAVSDIMFVVLSEPAAIAISGILGVEIPPGLYFSLYSLRNSGGACLIYG